MNASGTGTLEALFEGRPEALKLFTVVRLFIETIGPVKIEVRKTQISFEVERKFAWVWLPQMWVERPESSITLTFALGRRVEHPRIEEAIEPHPQTLDSSHHY